MAALLARKGFTANDQAFEHKQGFFNLYNGPGHFDIERAFDAWAEPLDIVNPGACYKQYPCCASTHAPVDAALQLRAQHHFAPGDITRIDTFTAARRLAHTNRPNPQTPLDAKFSVQYVVAATRQGTCVASGGTSALLDATGAEQARLLARRLLVMDPPAAVYCSPMRRARETVAPYVAATGAEVRYEGDLVEAHVGAWEGRSFEEIIAGDEQMLHRFRDQDAVWRHAPGAESVDDLRKRVGGAIEGILERHPDGNVFRRQRIVRGDQSLVGDVVVEGTYELGMQDQAFLGLEAALAIPDSGGGGVELHVATQWLHEDRKQIADCLGFEPESVRLVLGGVGGAFGAREDISLQVHSCLLALRTGRPVRAARRSPAWPRPRPAPLAGGRLGRPADRAWQGRSSPPLR